MSYEVKISPYQIPEEDLDGVEFCLDPMQVAIARFSDDEIRQMKRLDLVELIKTSRVFLTRQWMTSLRFMEYDELKQMAFLARRLCRQDVNAALRRQGREDDKAEKLPNSMLDGGLEPLSREIGQSNQETTRERAQRRGV